MSFSIINKKTLLECLSSAENKIVYAAPGIVSEPAEQIITFASKHGAEKVIIVIDPSPDIYQHGFGDIKAVEKLKGAGLKILTEQDIRIGVLIVDDNAWIFAPVSRKLEDDSLVFMNAVKINPAQAEEIINSISQPNVKLHAISSDTVTGNDTFCVGNSELSTKDLQKIHKKLDETPPPDFEAHRELEKLRSKIKSIKIQMENIKLHTKTIKIPSELLFYGANEEFQNRLNSSFKIVNNKSNIISTIKKTEKKLDEIRKKYTISMGSHFSRVFLLRKKGMMDKELDVIKKDISVFAKSIKNELQEEFKKTKKELIKILFPLLKKNPPKQLTSNLVEGKVENKNIEYYLEDKLNKIFPKLEDCLESMHLSIEISDISDDTFKDSKFLEALKKAFPYEDWNQNHRDPSVGNNTTTEPLSLLPEE